jgi:hypothetical protein
LGSIRENGGLSCDELITRERAVLQIFRRLFTDHPATVDETYFQHLLQALGFGITMIGAGVACILHALVPGLCVTRGSDAIADLHDRMVIKRRRIAAMRASSATTP